MNVLDVIVLVAFLALFGAAFLLGIARSIIWLVAVLAGLISASVFYRSLSEILTNRYDGLYESIADLLAFSAVAGVVAVAVSYVLLRSYRVARVRTRLTFETRGGALAIVLLALAAFLVASTMTVVSLQIMNRTLDRLPPDSTLVGVQEQFEGSILTTAALRVAPLVYRTVNALTPGSAADLLKAPGAIDTVGRH